MNRGLLRTMECAMVLDGCGEWARPAPRADSSTGVAMRNGRAGWHVWKRPQLPSLAHRRLRTSTSRRLPGQARPGPGWPRVAQTHNGEMGRLHRKPIDNAAGPKDAQGKVRRRNHALRFSSFPTLSTIFLGGTKGRGGQWKRHQTPKGGAAAAAAAAPQTTKKEGRGRLMQERARCSCHYCTARC